MFNNNQLILSNEEIHNTVLSILQSFSMLDNKLERHEQRERSLGEIIKKSLMTLQNGQRIFVPMKGTFSRLEERVSQIETLLLSQEERNTDQQTKLAEALDSILKWMVANGKKSTPMVESKKENSSEENKDDLEKKIEELNRNIKSLTKEVSELKALKGVDTENTNKIVELVSSNKNSTEMNIAKMEQKLTQFYVTNPSVSARTEKWEKDISSALADIQTNLGKSTPGESGSSIEMINNATLNAIERMRTEVMEASDKSFAKTASRIREAHEMIGKLVTDVSDNLITNRVLLNNGLEVATEERTALKKDVESLKELEKMMLKTADNVLDTKRRVEFGIHQIVLEVSEAVKDSSKELNSSLAKR